MIRLADVQRARQRIRHSVRNTQLSRSRNLSEACGAEIYLKYENHQITGAYKERGALNKLLQLKPEERQKGVVSASAGNHAQAVAYHGQQLGIAVTLLMPKTTPKIKIANTRGHGAKVILHGENFDEAYEEARRLEAEEGLVFVHPFDDPYVIAGQGTLALELLEQEPELDAIVVPIGGGGLIAGIAAVVQSLSPHTRVYGVEAEVSASMRRSLDAGEPQVIEGARTLADGIQVKRPGEITFAMIQELVEDVVTVSEEELVRAVLFLLERDKTLVEGAGAAGAAALLAGRIPNIEGQRVATILCGGNIDLPVLDLIITRGLIMDHRLMRMTFRLPDRPGSLAELLQVIASSRGSVVEIQHHRIFTRSPYWEAKVTVTVETQNRDHGDEILETLTAAGFPPDELEDEEG
ncbi:MAG: threonine ammonia-lyase [Acidobacteriota bacterium]